MGILVKLNEHGTDLVRGDVLRCKGRYPYEESVDFMIVELSVDAEIRYALMVVSGYKSGLVYSFLPKESIPDNDGGYAVSIGWLKSNWGSWGYFDCSWDDVWLVAIS